MKEFVDSFYLDMTIKIRTIIKTQKREIREMKTQVKCKKKRDKSVKHREEISETTVTSIKTVSSWTKEEQFERHQEIVHLTSAKNISDQSQQLDLPNFARLNESWDSCATGGSSCLSPAYTSSDCQLSAVDWRYDKTESHL